MEKPATAASYAASASAIVSGLTANEIGVYAGIVIGAATFLLNAWFRWQTLKLMRKAARDKALVIQEGN